MNPAKGAVYVPPRPNLGPESSGIPGGSASMALIVAGVLIATLLMGWVFRRKRRVRTRKVEAPIASAPAPATRREQVIAAATSVRHCLTEQFGPAWNARTTEEIAGDSVLESRLTGTGLARLGLLLKLADRAKFGVAAETDFDAAAYGEDWDALRAELLSLLTSSAGASSTTSG